MLVALGYYLMSKITEILKNTSQSKVDVSGTFNPIEQNNRCSKQSNSSTYLWTKRGDKECVISSD